MVPAELGLGNPEGSGEVFIGQGRVDDFVAVLRQVAGLDAARHRLPTVEEEDFHGDVMPMLPCCVQNETKSKQEVEAFAPAPKATVMATYRRNT
jgi:hypothetical protein